MSELQFSSPLDAALKYADIGWHVFPCTPDKKPFTEHGFHDATTDHATIVDWWRRWPNAQVGVACGFSGLAVVDLDVDKGKGKDGIATFALVEQESGPHWAGLVACTPRGGRHLVYLMPDPPLGTRSDVPVGMLAHGTRLSGVDIRADGGYVVVPSPASPGREWLVGDPFYVDQADGEVDITQMPEWLEQLLRVERKTGTAPGADSAEAMPIGPEQVAAIRRALQHIDSDPRDTWIRVGMALKSTGAKAQAYELWCEWSQRSSKFDSKVQERQWRSLREYFADGREVTLGTLFHLAKQGGYVPDLQDEIAVEIQRPVAGPSRPAVAVNLQRPFPRDLLNVPGLVGDITQWLLEGSRRPQPAMCLASAIATVGALLGRRVATPTNLRTNVYLLGIGETGCGKDAGVSLPAELLEAAGLQRFVGPGEWKSDSGLRAALIDAPSHAAYLDEFSKRLAMMMQKTAPSYLRGIQSHLLELWGKSGGTLLATAYANRKENAPQVIRQPNLCLYGTGVPSDIFTSVDSGAARDGFLNRFLFVWADDQLPKPRNIGRRTFPAELLDRLRALMDATDTGALSDRPEANPDAKTVPFTDDAQAMLDELDAANDRRMIAMRAEGNPLRDLWVRFAAHVAKLALIRTAADDPGRAVEVADIAWARDLVVWCLDRTMIEVENRVADSAQEALTKRVLRTIAEAGEAGLTLSTITRKTQWLRRSDRKDILATLVESGDVTTHTVDVPREDRGAVQVTYYRVTAQAPAAAIQQAEAAAAG